MRLETPCDLRSRWVCPLGRRQMPSGTPCDPLPRYLFYRHPMRLETPCGELAGSLFQVYEYARLQVLSAFKRDETVDLDQARIAIEGIKSAWTEIGPQVDGGAK